MSAFKKGSFGRDSSKPRFNKRDSEDRFERKSGGRDAGFSREGRSSSDGRSTSFNRGPPELFHAICGKCGEKCQIPFKPTGERPVYCRDCFQKDAPISRERSSPRDRTSSSQPSELDRINEKLDKIMRALKIN